jgi:hypothetical protein
MPVPQPRSLSLGEAASYVAGRCEVSVEDAKGALERAFREHSVSAYSCNWLTQVIPVRWDGATIAWENSQLKGARGFVIHREVYVLRKHLNEWMNESAPTSASSFTIAFDEASVQPGSVAGDAYTHSGFPGRPSKGKHLIDDEFDRRVETDQVCLSLRDEAQVLLVWLAKHHPQVPRPSLKTIENKIRTGHRHWKSEPAIKPSK